MIIEIKELIKIEIINQNVKAEIDRVSALLTTHQNELRPTLLQYLSRYNTKIRTEEEAAKRFVTNIAKHNEKLKMIYAVDSKSDLVVGLLHYTPLINEHYIKHLLEYYPNNFTSPQQLANKTALEYLIIHKDFRSEGIGRRLDEEMIRKIKDNINTDGVIVKTQSTNNNALEFYKKIGYSQIGEVIFPDKFREEHGCPDEGSLWLEKRI